MKDITKINLSENVLENQETVSNSAPRRLPPSGSGSGEGNGNSDDDETTKITFTNLVSDITNQNCNCGEYTWSLNVNVTVSGYGNLITVNNKTVLKSSSLKIESLNVRVDFDGTINVIDGISCESFKCSTNESFIIDLNGNNSVYQGNCLVSAIISGSNALTLMGSRTDKIVSDSFRAVVTVSFRLCYSESSNSVNIEQGSASATITKI